VKYENDWTVMKLRVGHALTSTVDGTMVLVIRAPVTDCTLTCGGVSMVDAKSAADIDRVASITAVPPDAVGTQLGKRYVDADETIEVLCTKPGSHALAVDGVLLSPKVAKALPASD
jgi:hypothetical protein